MHLFWQAGIGESPFAYRYGSVLLGLLGVAAAMRLGWRWYGAAVGLSAGIMVAVSPLLWDYSQEVRAYIAVPLLAILLLYGADRLLHHHPRQRDWALVFLTELVALYTHNLAVPLVIWLNVTLILFWLFRRDGRHLTLWIVSQVALGLLYLPWVLSQTPSGTPLNTPPTVGLGLLRDIWYSYFLPVPLQLRDAGSSLPLDLLGLLLLVGSVALLLKILRTIPPITSRHPLVSSFPSSLIPRPSYLLLSHILLVPTFTTILILAAHIDFHPRYFIAALPATLILLAAGVAALSKLVCENPTCRDKTCPVRSNPFRRLCLPVQHRRHPIHPRLPARRLRRTGRLLCLAPPRHSDFAAVPHRTRPSGLLRRSTRYSGAVCEPPALCR